jgi:hypothetical protein
MGLLVGTQRLDLDPLCWCNRRRHAEFGGVFDVNRQSAGDRRSWLKRDPTGDQHGISGNGASHGDVAACDQGIAAYRACADLGAGGAQIALDRVERDLVAHRGHIALHRRIDGNRISGGEYVAGDSRINRDATPRDVGGPVDRGG